MNTRSSVRQQGIPQDQTQTQSEQASRSQPQAQSPSPAAIKQAQFDFGISLSLSLWPALTAAVTNSWGGPDSAEKRDWFAGAISDLFTSRPDTDEEELECVLLQVMEDEFDARLEDESEVQVAVEICQMRRNIEKGDFSGVELLREKWTRSQGKSQLKMMQAQQADDDEDDMEFSDEDSDEEGGVDVDAEMIDDDPPLLVPIERRTEPDIDEDGFTKVVGKKKNR